jgi:hypothetical protein
MRIRRKRQKPPSRGLEDSEPLEELTLDDLDRMAGEDTAEDDGFAEFDGWISG